MCELAIKEGFRACSGDGGIRFSSMGLVARRKREGGFLSTLEVHHVQTVLGHFLF